MKIQLPYGKEGEKVIEILDKNLIGVFEANDIKGPRNETQTVKEALSNPIGAERLSTSVDPEDKITVVISDASRPNVERKVLPLVMEELQGAGVRRKNVTVLVGCGYHRPATEGEIREKLGELYGEVRVINHEAEDTADLVYLGKTGGDISIKVNRCLAEADFKITIGTVLPHPMAGFSGGPKAVAIGVAGRETIVGTHNPGMIRHPKVGIGIIEGNPFYGACEEIARSVQIDFTLNLMVNKKGEITHAAAGDLEAHRRIIEVAKEVFTVSVPEVADVAVLSVGYPKDSNLYHACALGLCTVVGSAVKEPLVRDGGMVITIAPCQEGVYNKEFYRWLSEAKRPEEVLERAEREGVLRPGQHRAFGVAEILLNHKALVASHMPPEIIKELHMTPIANFSEGFKMAKEEIGENAKFSVFINTHRMIPKLQGARGRIK